MNCYNHVHAAQTAPEDLKIELKHFDKIEGMHEYYALHIEEWGAGTVIYLSPEQLERLKKVLAGDEE